MKVLVIEIEKDTLRKYLQKFELTDQITFLDGLEIPDEDAKYETAYDNVDEPYYIEESIIDLDKYISLCSDINYIQEKLDWHEFCGFWDLILNIKKQRDIGYPIDDVEYIYKMGIKKNLPIKYHHVSELYGYAEGTDFYVITGQSNLGQMDLYHDGCDFVFTFSRNTSKKFSEMEFNEFTHWHPYTCIDALNDMIALMTNDKDYFENNGLSILEDN